MTVVPVRSPRASWVNSARAGTVYGSRGDTRVGYVKGTTQFTYVAFGMPTGLRRGATLLSATLRVPLNVATTGTQNWTAQRAGAAWRTRALKWSNKPGVTGAASTTSVPASAAGAFIEFDVRADLQSWLDTVGGTHPGWQLSTADPARRAIRATSAELVIEYVYAPAAPVDLSPAGGAVSVSHPLLTFTAPGITALQVVADTDLIFTAGAPVTPDYDSGEITTTVPAHDLAGTVFAGITLGGAVEWAARVKNSSGWSAWSQIATVSRAAKPPLSIVAPVGSVYDSQPLLDADMTGMTAVQWLVQRIGGPTERYDSGRIASTDGQHTPTRRALTVQGATYRVTVTAWDGVARVSGGPNDPPYMTATTTVVLDYSPVTNGPDQVMVAPLAVLPGLRVEFTEDTPGDAYTFEFGNGWARRIDVGDLDVVSAGRYGVTLWEAPLNVETTLTVRPHVDDVSGEGVTLSLLLRTGAVWLVDPVTGDAIAFVDVGDGVAWGSTELATVHYAEGLPYPSRRRQGRRAPSGTVTGWLVDSRYGQAADMLALVERWADPDQTPADKVFRLVAGHVNVPVWIGDLDTRPSSATTADRLVVPVSLSFWVAPEPA